MYVIGTAGHVDHGKSTLVKTLTGIDPDRWEEERRREMTIDLGFAWLTLPSGRSVSIVDVPGHERFIKNMLAGVGGIDAALLVIAADEWVMPQTEEHLAILDLLDVRHGLVVLTKADLVDEEWLELVGEEVRERLRGTSFAEARQVAVSARTGQGLETLLALLDAELDRTPTRAQAQGEPRLPIDRAFTVGGFGTVVTGTLLDGLLHVGDEVEILPKRLKARVRGLQTHQQKEEAALTGHACRGQPGRRLASRPGPRRSVGAAGPVAPDRAARCAPAADSTGAAAAARRICGWTCSSAPPRYTAARRCSTARSCRPARPAGCNCAWSARSRWRAATASLCGSRRPAIRSAAGAWWTPSPRATGASAPRSAPRLRRWPAAPPAICWGAPSPTGSRTTGPELLKSSGLPAAAAAQGLVELVTNGTMVVLGTRDLRLEMRDSAQHTQSPIPNLQSQWLISASGWATLRERLGAALHGYHRRFPLRMGMPREELRSRLKLNGEGLDAALATARAEGLAATHEGSVRLPEHTPTPAPDQERAVRRLLDAFAAAPHSPPALDLEPELAGWLVEQGKIVRVAEDVAFTPQAYAEMVAWVRQQIGATGGVTVAQFRDHFGTSRKYALALLEHLDERKLTRRTGDVRVLY